MTLDKRLTFLHLLVFIFPVRKKDRGLCCGLDIDPVDLGRVLNHLAVGVKERDHLGAGQAPEHHLLVLLVLVLHKVLGAGILPVAEWTGVLQVLHVS